MLTHIREAIPFETVAPSFVSLYMLAEAYNAIDDREGVIAMMQRAEPLALEHLENARSAQSIEVAAQYIQTIQSLYMENLAFEEAAAFSNAIALATGDMRYRQSADELREMHEAQFGPETVEDLIELPADEPQP